MKIGIDIHGVLDTFPEFFSFLTEKLKKNGYEIHIITGARETEKIHKELKSYNIIYDKFFSILDYHTKIGTEIIKDSNDEEWILDEKWDRTKAEYCKNNNIDIHIDDTEKYGKYFETGFIYLEKGEMLSSRNIDIDNIKLFNIIRKSFRKIKS